MAIFRSKLILLLILFCLTTYELHVHAAEAAQVGEGVVKIDCGGRCKGRCSKSSRPNLCLRACNSCCYRCNCVPPGTAGNHHLCPCYASITTRGGRLKCP
ncbi:Gibberellin regulated protein [Arabidopsis thaliana x Arabidopsis arenosa]|uniref:Gibberellin regulated protein n=1 Tax=Arabidopsis thaliana x Arabidopsis arenosa TaxID=1240361 RepID=A0A8T1Z154_9BRAS|nr:Gibberellin regulated protein [Arabidopsis thaliana x Arabidopsis arenosa]